MPGVTVHPWMQIAICFFVTMMGVPAYAATLEQFGGGFGVVDNSSAWARAIASFPAAGGRLELGCGGSYRFASPVTTSSYIEIKGCGGEGTTTIDCSAITALAPCLSFTGYGVRLNGFLVLSPTGAGIAASNSAFVEIEDVDVVDNRALDANMWSHSCITLYNVWETSIEDVRLVTCRTFALEVNGYNTTLTVSRLYGDHPAKSCVMLNGLTYAHFDTPACDSSGDYAYWVRNSGAVTFTSPGAEYAAKGMFLFTASTAEGASATVKDVRGVVIEAPFSFGNGYSQPYYSSLIEAASLNGRPIDITVIGGMEHTSPNSKSMLLSGTGVRVSRIGGTWKGAVSATGGAVFAALF